MRDMILALKQQKERAICASKGELATGMMKITDAEGI